MSTFAGSGAFGHADGQGTAATFFRPQGVTLDGLGNLYVTDGGTGGRIRKIDPSANVTSIGGTGVPGSSDSPSAFFVPTGAVFDDAGGKLFIADSGNQRIRTIVSTTAGTYTGLDNGFADGPLASARFAQTRGLATDGDGHLLVTDAFSSLIRQVDLNPPSQGFTPSVTTIAGTGQIGSADGTGTSATFNSPWGIAVSQSGAIYIADNGNNTIRRILFAPVVTSFTPAGGSSGDVVTINGHYFDGRSPSNNIVSFAKSGGGLTQATVSLASRTQLVVIVPADAATGPISVQTQGGTGTSAASFQVAGSSPVITDFNPKSGDVGTTVTITGTSLHASSGPTTVSFVGSDGSLQAMVTSATSSSTQVIVPNGAVTGPITLTTPFGSATTATNFTVVPAHDFQITLSPSQATVVQGATATYIVSVTSTQATFSQLVELSASGLAGGVNAEFEPEQITAGATSVLTVDLSQSGLSAGNYSFSVIGTGMVSGADRSHTTSASLNVTAAGQTTLSGRVLASEDESPIPGATVSLDGHSATTDGAGSFLLSGINAGVDRPVVIDGRTASVPNRTYPTITEPATVVANQVNQMPFEFYLPTIDIQFEVTVVPNQTTVVTTPRVAGMSVTIPAGANLRNRDGSPVTKASVTPVPIDRTPTPLPSNVGPALVYTLQPGGAISDIAMPVVYPNLNGLDPGVQMNLYRFNHDTVQWEIYGTGHVSADGRTVNPDIDPSTGQPFGLRDFSWYFPAPTQSAPEGNPAPCDSCMCALTKKTVDMSNGMKIEKMTDIAFGGARGSLELTRIYTSDLAIGCTTCPFGTGWTHNYAIRLSGSFQTGGAGRLIRPGELTGRLFNYAGTDPSDGALLFSSTQTVGLLGDVIRKLTDGTFQYRMKNGDLMRFDAAGKLTALVDRNGNTTSLTYSAGNLTSVTDPVGRSITFSYNSNLIVSATDPIGRVWNYAYGPKGLATVTDPLTHTMSYVYGQNGLLQKVFDYRGTQAKLITYSTGGRVIREEYGDGGVDMFTYAVSGALVTSTTRTDPQGRVTSMRFDARGYVLASSDGLGQTSTVQRAIGPSLPLSISGPCGCAQVTSTFDGNGNVLTNTDALNHTETFEYDPVFNNVTKYTDKLGKITAFGHDSTGNLTSITQAAGTLNLTTTFSYDSFGELTSVTDPLGHATQSQYDASGNVTARIDALSHQSTFSYDGIGRPTSGTDPLGRTETMGYNALFLTDVTDAAGAVTLLEYDQNGNRTRLTDALQHHWIYSYDLENRNTAITDPLGRISVLLINFDNELIGTISPSGRATAYSYDSRGLPATLTDALGGVVSLTYDNQGHLISLKNERGNTTTYSYDELFRPIAMVDPVGNSSTTTYNAMGNILDAVDRLGRQTSITYDLLNRPSQVSYADATVTPTYDAASRVTRIDDTQSGFVQWSYDDANRIISETTPNGIVSYGYNIASQPTSMTAGSRPVVSYDYDTPGRLHTITQGAETFTYSYDTLSRQASLQRPNGVTTSYSYDQVGRLTRLLHSNAQSQAIEDFIYTYNLDDEIASISSLFSSQLLTPAITSSPADGANRITQFGGSNLSFDNKGQTISNATSQGGTSYEWDARGRMKRATLANGQQSSYGYDALGRRASRTASGVTTSFLYDGADVVLDQGSDGSLVDYINGEGMDEKLRQSSAGGPLYFLQDHLGSTTALLDANGGVTERTQYEAFGQTAGSALSRYSYTGRERDSMTGLMYYRARWYDPQQGRFVIEDPIGATGGLNLYAYVHDDPIGYIDPFGLQTGAAARAPIRTPPPVSVPVPEIPPVEPIPIRPPVGIAGRAGAAGIAFAVGWIIGRGIGEMPTGYKRTVDDDIQDWMIKHIWGKPDPGPSWPPKPQEHCQPQNKEKERCLEVQDKCSEQCWKNRVKVPKYKGQDTFLLLRKCIRECMADQGCHNY